MTETGTRAVMEGYLRALVDRGDFARFFADDVLWTTMETGDEVRGRDQVRDLIVGLHTQVFDARPELLGLITCDGNAVVEARFVGTHIGDFGDLPATGREVDLPYCVVYDVADGLITALRPYMSMVALRAQLTQAESPAERQPEPA